VYFKISEEYFTKSDEIDGHWAKVALESGKRAAILLVAETPGKYHDTDGEGISRLTDGVIYGALRYDREHYPSSRFGALGLESQKKLWEVRGSNLRTKPAVNDKFVFTVIDGAVAALERKTGRVVWSEPLGEIAETNIDRSQDRPKWHYENEWSRRLVATNEVVIVQGSQGIAALRADNGKLIWLVKTESDAGNTDPIVLQQTVVAASLQNCSVFALDLKDGKELWRVNIPECTYYYIFDE
jgi:outer membrane protein assembly factor BamB